LRHPRIVEAYHYASDPHGLFYTMELIDGPDLRAATPMPWRQTCFLLRDIALSLAIVHSRRLVHRDVGPGNVRLSRDGRAKLLDFGATVSMGIPCDVVGTPPCTPPEAFAYEPLDARADLFGLGALGYYLLTGEHAYPASTT
jgi:serine/threonine protein kinase